MQRSLAWQHMRQFCVLAYLRHFLGDYGALRRAVRKENILPRTFCLLYLDYSLASKS
jgi:hypothetical protein